MSLPQPEAGLVIRYSYLWYSEFHAGREEGVKDRPCAIVFAVSANEGSGATRVLVLPVTHRAPDDPGNGIEIPKEVKRRLGLDDDRSWVVLTEWNEFYWPGPDLRHLPGGDVSTVAYGLLPARFATHVRKSFAALVRKRRALGALRT